MRPMRWTRHAVGACLLCAVLAPGAGAAEKAAAKADAASQPADYPKMSLSNGVVKLTVHLPDGKNGYYRGSRFDWSGVVGRVEYKGHTFFGPWHSKHDPAGHDAIEGTAEEFSMFKPLGFDEVQAGGVFYKIGIGGLTRTEKLVKDKATGRMVPQEYSFWGRYRIAKLGEWKVTRGETWVQFVQDFTGERDWGWHYTKRISLVAGSPAFTISRRLENTGKKPIDTTHYCHNFTLIDDQPVGPDYSVVLPFNARVEELKGTLAKVEGREIVFLGLLTGGKTVWMELGGLRGTALDNAAAVANRKTGASVTITGDRPLLKYRFWATALAACPEPFVAVKLAPGTSMSWSNTYTFGVFEAKKAG